MTLDELRNLLKERGIIFTEKPVQHGTRIDCKTGETFNVFDTGKMSFQRKQVTPLSLEIKALYEGRAYAVAVDHPPDASPPSLPREGACFYRLRP